MAFLAKINEIAQNVGDKANGALETSKLKTQKQNDEKLLIECRQQLGEFYLNMLRTSDSIPEPIQELYQKILDAEKRLTETTAELDRRKAAEAAAYAGAPSYGTQKCPSCGADISLNARFCPECGKNVGA